MGNNYPDYMLPWHEQMRVEAEPPPPPLDPSFARRCEESQSVLSATRVLVRDAHKTMQDSLCDQLLGYVHVQSATFFETLIIDVVVALGYAGRRRDMARKLGRSGDGGIDGVIDLDELGLDSIYLQAKRLKPGATVSVSAVRDFVGALETRRATKGVFVTTGNFTPAAHGIVRAISKRIVLIDGRKLTQLMVRFNVGAKVTDSLQFKEVDMSYFTTATTRPASSQVAK